MTMKVLLRDGLFDRGSTRLVSVEDAAHANLDRSKSNAPGSDELSDALTQIGALESMVSTLVGILADKGALNETELRRLLGDRVVDFVSEEAVAEQT